ncbi:MAG: transposase [Bacteroidota bacterium]
MVAFRPLFDHRVFERALVLVAGAILAVRTRTVTAALRAAGQTDAPFSAYHRVLSRARWSCLDAARVLLGLLVGRFVPEGPIIVGCDDTIERRWGPTISARGIYRDPVRSSRGHFVKTSGLRWLSLSVLTPVSWAGRVWALPFLTVLCPSTGFYGRLARRPVTLTERARQAVLLLARWLRVLAPGRRVVMVADSGFSTVALLAAVREHVTVVTRLRLDAALYGPIPPRPPGRHGRPRKRGDRLPSLIQRVADPATEWTPLKVSRWYGKRDYAVEVATGLAWWYRAGVGSVPLRWVVVRDPGGSVDPKGLLCTDPRVAPEVMLGWFLRRWSVEVTFAEVRRHLGVETQRQWSDLAITRTTPCLLGLFSVVALAADRLHVAGALPTRQSAWYRKEAPTFSDALAGVRMSVWRAQGLSMSRSGRESVEIPEAVLWQLTSTLAYAA